MDSLPGGAMGTLIITLEGLKKIILREIVKNLKQVHTGQHAILYTNAHDIITSLNPVSYFCYLCMELQKYNIFINLKI